MKEVWRSYMCKQMMSNITVIGRIGTWEPDGEWWPLGRSSRWSDETHSSIHSNARDRNNKMLQLFELLIPLIIEDIDGWGHSRKLFSTASDHLTGPISSVRIVSSNPIGTAAQTSPRSREISDTINSSCESLRSGGIKQTMADYPFIAGYPVWQFD